MREARSPGLIREDHHATLPPPWHVRLGYSLVHVHCCSPGRRYTECRRCQFRDCRKHDAAARLVGRPDLEHCAKQVSDTDEINSHVPADESNCHFPTSPAFVYC